MVKFASQCSLMGIILKNSFITIEAKGILLTQFGYSNKTITIDKYVEVDLSPFSQDHSCGTAISIFEHIFLSSHNTN